MSIDNSALDLLEGGGKTAKFATIGDIVKGTVVSASSKQQTEFGTGKPLTWDNGDPKMELVVTLATDERDPDDATDDGTRVLYAKGAMLAAIRAARQGKTFEAGGTLAVKYVSDKPSSTPGYNPAKQFVAEYQAPPVIADVESLI